MRYAKFHIDTVSDEEVIPKKTIWGGGGADPTAQARRWRASKLYRKYKKESHCYVRSKFRSPGVKKVKFHQIPGIFLETPRLPIPLIGTAVTNICLHFQSPELVLRIVMQNFALGHKFDLQRS